VTSKSYQALVRTIRKYPFNEIIAFLLLKIRE
jgi:hypothetical protein